MTKYEISGLPALLILDENGEVLSRSDGALTEVEEFIEFGELAYYKLNPETSPWYKNEQAFKAGERDYLFLQEYAVSLVQGDAEYEKIKEVNDLFWKNSPTKSLKDTTNFLMFYIFESELSSGLIESFIIDKDELIATVGESVYYTKGIDIIQVNIDDATVSDDNKKYQAILRFTKRVFTNQDVVDYNELIESIEDIWKDR